MTVSFGKVRPSRLIKLFFPAECIISSDGAANSEDSIRIAVQRSLLTILYRFSHKAMRCYGGNKTDRPWQDDVIVRMLRYSA